MSFGILKLGDTSFGMSKLGEFLGFQVLGYLGETSFGVLVLGELGEMSFGNVVVG